MTSSLESERQKGRRTMSTSIRKLQEALNMHLDTSEKMEFVDILNQYHVNRDVKQFVNYLKLLLDTPAKWQLFGLLKKVIPKTDLEQFEQYVAFSRSKFATMPTKQSGKPQRSRPPLTTRSEKPKSLFHKPGKIKKGKNPKLKGDNQSNSVESKKSKSSSSLQAVRTSNSLLTSDTKGKGSEIRCFEISQDKDDGKGFGFSIRGGADFGIGVYVSKVDIGGLAAQQGLKPGDLLMEVNNVSFDKISHEEAAQIIKSCAKVDMTVCRVGRIPGSFVVHQMYKWVDSDGRPVSPPPELEQLGKTDSIGSRSGLTLLKGADERKISVSVAKGGSLGIMIRGGREFGLGIYISGVDPLSLADDAGIKVGSQILNVNGQSFLDITHAEAVRVLKTSKHLVFTIKDVGKLPYGRTKIDQTNWVSGQPRRRRRHNTDSQNSDSAVTVSSSGTSVFRKGIGSQLMYNTAISSKWDVIENQALELLNDTEQGTLRYYLSEYKAGFITVDGLAMASFELLNTKAKMSMMSEIRNWVRPQDLNRFDVLLHRREAQRRLEPQAQMFTSRHGQKQVMSGGGTLRNQPMHVERHVPEWELEPLRRAIQQIEVNEPDNMYQSGLKYRSYSTDNLSMQSPNLLKSSLSSQHSISMETLTPVYIDTVSDLPPSPRLPQSSLRLSQSSPRLSDSSSRLSQSSPNLPHRSRNHYADYNFQHSPRQQNASVNSSPWLSARSKPGNRYKHRQRSASGDSSLRQRHRSMEDIRNPMSVKRQPRRSSEVRDRLSSVSYTHLDDTDHLFPQTGNNVVYVDVHQPPRQPDGSPSDDSGVEVSGNLGNDITNRMYSGNFSLRQKRVTISSDNPINIDDVLESRSFIIPPTHGNLSNHSTLTNRSRKSVRSNHSNHSTLTNHSRRSYLSFTGSIDNNSGYDDAIRSVTSSPKLTESTSRRNGNLPSPVEIQINDGNGSIETMSLESPNSPRFVNQRRTGPAHKYGRSKNRSRFDTSDDEDEEDDDDIYGSQRTYTVRSDMNENSDLFTSPIDKILNEEDSISDYESRQIEEARKRYGNIPLYIIPVYKTKPTLGMAIEGGANTRQPLPRVISLQPGGSAYESGSLKVGHVILEVNGKSLIGLEHITAAKTVAEAFKNNARDHMELLVTESDAKVNLRPQ